MWIKEADIKNFGQFSNRHFNFVPGINLIYGENESGKTTLHTFIRGSLYGVRKMRGRASRNDLYSRYEPWENPAYYAGNLRFVCGDKTFRLERDFERSRAGEQLICETDGELLSVEDGDLHMLLGGVGEAVFENTVYVSQMKSRTGESLAVELKNYMANYQEGKDSLLDVQKALNTLKEQKKEQEKLLREKEDAREKEQNAVRLRTEYIQEDIDRDKEEWNVQNRILQRMERPREAQEESRSSPKKAMTALVIKILALCAASALAAFYLKHWWVAVLLGAAVLGVTAVLTRGYVKRYFKKQKNAPDVGSAGENPETIRWMMERLEKEISEKETELENLMDQAAETGDDSWVKQDENRRALELAMEHIENITRNMHQGIGQQLKARTSVILSDLTGGKYRQVQIDDSLQVGVHAKQRYIPLEQLSRGTIEQVYFALRMGAGEILCQEEPLPIILDDVFAMYDENRLRETLKWLAGQDRQVLLFTCHRREEELLRKMNIPFEINLLNNVKSGP